MNVDYLHTYQRLRERQGYDGEDTVHVVNSGNRSIDLLDVRNS